MDLDTITKIVGLIATCVGGLKYIPKGWRWLQSWKIVKRKEFERLLEVEAEYRKYAPAIERDMAYTAAVAQQIKRQMEQTQNVRKIDEDLFTEIRKKLTVGPLT